MASETGSRVMDAREYDFVPGTVRLEQMQQNSMQLVLQPQPSDDPEDPLNWSTWRKYRNLAIACYYTLITFVLLDIGSIVWVDVVEDLGVTFTLLNHSTAMDFAGLAIGCWLVIPLSYRYGRRPVYIISSAVQLAGAIWLAKVHSGWEILVANLVAGLGGAISETIVQMTISDLFFVHQHATINACYLFFVYMGAYLGPVCAGYSAVSQGWRWIWWWCTILLVVNFLLILFFFEETKYIPTINGQPVELIATTTQLGEKDNLKLTTQHKLSETTAAQYPRKTWRQRLAFATPTKIPLAPRYFEPLHVLITIPAVAYTALMYGAMLAWFAILLTTQSEYMTSPPWNFTTAALGLFSLSGFLGALFGAVLGGPLNDVLIIWLSKRNGGIFEPEMRLWLCLPALFLCPAGILLFGLGLAHGLPWIKLAVGVALFTCGFNMVLDVTLTYLLDCYHDIIGDALVGVSLVRNGISIGILFAITPWIESIGLQNFFICTACLCFGLISLTIPMIILGKSARKWRANLYSKVATTQPVGRRDFGANE